jgi:predicted transcriptional regulator
VELGDLELAVLHAVRMLGEASSGDVYDELRKSRNVAYTSVTTTLYRLVDKDLVAQKKLSEKRIYYRIKNGPAYRKAMASMVDSLLDAFGGAAVSYLLDNPSRLSAGEMESLRDQASRRRQRESLHE